MPRRAAVFVQNRDFFGAMLVHVPLLWAIRQYLGDGSRLDIYAPFPIPFFGLFPWIAEVRTYRRVDAALRVELRERCYDLVVDLRPRSLGLTLVLAWVCCGRVVGYSNPLTWLLPGRFVPRDTTIYRMRNYLRLMQLIDDRTVIDAAQPFVELARTVTVTWPPLDCLPLVAIPCGGQTVKHWGPANYAALLALLVRRHPTAQIAVIVGATEESAVRAALAPAVLAHCRLFVNAGPAVHAALCLAARVVVANDCGPSHVAQCLGSTMVLLYQNQDGSAARMAAEWTDRRPGMRVLTTPVGQALSTLLPTAVADAVDDLLAEPQRIHTVCDVVQA